MKNLLELILNHIVDHPESVVVEESVEENQHVYRISVHPEDIGKVIGRNGHVIQSIRSVAKVRAMKDNMLVRIYVNEPATEG